MRRWRPRGAHVVLAAQRPLHGLLRSPGAEVVVIDERDVPPRFDLHCPLLSLPLVFGTVPYTIPAAVPYLHAEPALAVAWRRTFGDGGKKIGICWQGSASRQSLNRSFPLAALAPLARLPGVRLISLQNRLRAGAARRPAGPHAGRAF